MRLSATRSVRTLKVDGAAPLASSILSPVSNFISQLPRGTASATRARVRLARQSLAWVPQARYTTGTTGSNANVDYGKTFDKILIANRGEIACRIIRTARKMGIKTVAIYSEADANALHVRMADEAVCVGPAPIGQSYLNVPAILEAIRSTGAQAVHPGYGFLSENADFCEQLTKAGIVFIGPPASAMRSMSNKLDSKRTAMEAGVNTIPGYKGVVRDEAHALQIAHEIGYPVMVKASAGGGGKGMRFAFNDEELRDGYQVALSESKSIFKDDRLLVEKYIDQGRHIEIQIIGDAHGNTFYLPERECSIQRRNQKVIEEAPSVALDQATRDAMGKQAVALARKVGYTSAGTVEFIVDKNRQFYFLEMNTRLQVEHPITELISGVDLVEQMIRAAAGQTLTLRQEDLRLAKGWAIESRVYAEDPRQYLPCIGRLSTYVEPEVTLTAKEKEDKVRVRCDSGIVEGSEISIYYDPMICKLSTWAPSRQGALDLMARALDSYVIKGVTHNVPLLREVITNKRFVDGTKISTKFLPEEFPHGCLGHPLTEAESEAVAAIAAYIHVEREQRATQIVNARSYLSFSSTEPCQLQVKILDQEDAKPTSLTIERISRQMIERNDNDQSLSADDLNQLSAQLPDNAYAVTIKDRVYVIDAQWLLESPLLHVQLDTTAENGPSTTIRGEHVVQYLGRNPLGYSLQLFGTRYQVQVLTQQQSQLQPFMKVKPKPNVSNMILSPMPGSVVKVTVKVGDIVATGTEVAVVEAMKMQNVLRASRAARVVAVHCKPGQRVAADELLIELGDVEDK